MLRNNKGFRLKYKSRSILNAIIKHYGGNGIYNITGPKSQKEKRALVIYTAEALSKYLSNTLSSFTSFTSHSGFGESIAMLNVLLDMGYTVDYFNITDTPAIEWEKYELVIDGSNNLQRSKEVNGQKKIYYSTGCHWKTFYDNAYKHTNSFYKRNGLLLYPDRELKTNYSDEVADIITCFGGTYQAESYFLNKQKVRKLNISTTYIPLDFHKTIALKNKFIWYGGHGPFHKGIDLVTEAFLKMPDMELHIFGNIELNHKLYEWFVKTTANAKNITYHGWATPESEKFKSYVQQCDAFVFASSSEGGAGSVIQCLQFGLIPIINQATAVDLSNDKFNITGKDPEEEIDSIIEKVRLFSKTNSEELLEYSGKLKKHYCELHTIDSYAGSLEAVIRSI